MHDDVEHVLFRRPVKRRPGETRVVSGTVVEVADELARVQLMDGVDPVWVRMDGVTGAGAAVQVPLGTDGTPLGLGSSGDVPEGVEPEFVGATGKRILGQQVVIDQTVQELAESRATLAAAETKIDDMLLDVDGLSVAMEAAGWKIRIGEQDLYGNPHSEGDMWLVTNKQGAITDVRIWSVTKNAWTRYALVASSLLVPGSVGSTLIADGAVTSAKVNVTEELTARLAAILKLSAEQVIIGRDARFTSGGLVFYAPPAEGQDPADWPNRTPLISITPSGDVSIAVAQDGQITAGITPDGGVWGRLGAFDRLQVAGEDVTRLLDRAPRGILALTRITSNAPISNTMFTVGTVSAPIFKDRTYRVNNRYGMSRTAGAVSVETWMRSGATYKAISVGDQYSDGDFVTPLTFVGSDLGIADGASCTIETRVRTKTAGATGTLWGQSPYLAGQAYLSLEDIGPAVTPTVVAPTGSSPATPTPTRYGPTTFTSNGVRGVRPDGSFAIDDRLTVGGYSLYGTDMAEYIWYTISLNPLDGSTVLSAQLVLTVTSNAPIQVHVDMCDWTNPLANRSGIWSGTLDRVGTITIDIPSQYAQRLVGRGGILVYPAIPGSSASYGYLAASAQIHAIWQKTN